MASVTWLNWPAPSSVKACYTLRSGGYSGGSYNSFNVGLHVGDCPTLVHKNRQHLKDLIDNPDSAICWLTQVHGVRVVEASMAHLDAKADASYCHQPGLVAAVMTADCLPVFFSDQQGSTIAIAHAGWKGLLNGILLKTLDYFTERSTVMAYLGPAISAAAYEVGDDLRLAFMAKDKKYARYFRPIPHQPISHQPTLQKDFQRGDKWLCDLYGIARYQLNRVGVYAIYGGDRCTFHETSQFFSYRRDGVTGRMASMIWKTNQ